METMNGCEFEMRTLLLASLLTGLASQPPACLADGNNVVSTGAPIKGGIHDDAQVQSSTRLFTQPAAVKPLPVQQYSGAPNRVKKTAPVPPVVKPKVEQKPTDEQPKPEVKLWGRAEDKEEEKEAKPSARLWGEPPEATDGTPAKKTPAAKSGNGSTPAYGVKSYQPGYEVTEVKVLPPVRPGMRSVAGRLRVSAAPREAVAAQLSLPRHVPANWSEWYDRVAHAIYQVWQQQSVGPGDAAIRTTVFDTNDVDCQITDFQPAGDIARHAEAESRFRDAALAAVSSLDKSSVCQFPAVHPKKVSFDVHLSRLVDGPAGCRVIHTNEADRVTQH
jgi:hypothetical protein